MDFFTGQELIGVCQEKALPISEIMKLREMTTGSLSSEEIDSKLETVLSIMKNAATRPLLHPGKSIGGLIGGEAKKSKRSWENHFLCLWQYAFEGNLL